jgi:malate dehydrogenase (oxaloacetate-decarboxylating)
VFSALRILEEPLSEQRIVIHGAGAAGLGIARQLKAALREQGVPDQDMHRHLALLDSRGLLVDDQSQTDAYKTELAWPHGYALELGIDGDRSLDALVAAYRPTVLIGTSGQPGAFHESLVKAMAASVRRPVILPMSNPTANTEATPADLLAWTDGRALVATGSPFEPVTVGDRVVHIGQGNNVFVFPALGLGALLAGARGVSDDMITRAAMTLAEQITEEELAAESLYPDIRRLRDITATCAAAVCEQAYAEGLATAEQPADFLAAAREAMWWPDYPEFI